MARAKKPPTFGQHPYDPTAIAKLPAAAWEPTQDLTHIQNIDGVLIAGSNAQREVQIASEFLFPGQVQQYQDWAVHNPTADPRSWAPLAEGGILPNSQQGKAVSNGIIASQVNDATHGVAIGSNQTLKPSQWSSPSQGSPFAGPAGSVTPVNPGAGESPYKPLMDVLGSVIDPLTSAAGIAVRGTQYTLQSGWDAGQAMPRTGLGEIDKQMEVARKYGLSREEAAVAFPIPKQLQDVAGRALNTLPSNESQQPQQEGFLQSVLHTLSQTSDVHLPTVNTISADREAVIKQAQDAYAAIAPTPAEGAQKIADQTHLGWIAHNPKLLTEDSGILAGSPAIGAATEQSAINAFETRRADEIVKGVKPFGWTPGRGIAHVYAAPDTQAFNTMSGIIDGGSNLVLDPANRIPIGALGRVARAGSDLVDMMAGGGTNFAGGAIRRGQRLGGAQIAVQTTGLPVAEISNAEKAAVQAYTGTGHKIVNNGLRSDVSTVKNPTAGMSKVAAARTEALDSAATKHALESDTVLYRTVDTPIPTATGRIIEHKGFASTTVNAPTAEAGQTVLRIHAPEGTAGIDVAKALGSQSDEFILPRGTKFKVTRRVDQIGGEEGAHFIDVTIKNPKKATGIGPATGGLAAARTPAAGAAVADAFDESGNLAYRTSDPNLRLPDGSNMDMSTGLVTGNNAWIVMGEHAWNFLNSGRGQRLVADLADPKNNSASRIMARSNWQIDHELADTLAKATTPEEVRAAIGTRMGFDLNDAASLRNFGSRTPAIFRNVALRDNGVLNYLRKAPQARPFDLEDTDNTITQVSRFARGARMKWDQIEPHLDNIIAAKGDGVKTYNAIYGNDVMLADGTTKYVPGLLDDVAKHMADTLGIDAATAHKVTRAFQGGLDKEKRLYVNTGMANAMGVSADDASVGSALLDSELLTGAAVLPDYRTVRELTGAIGRILHESPTAEKANIEITKLINSATSAWKTAVLVRPAYVFREVGEMAVASSLAGYEGALTNPAGFLGMVLSTVAQKEAATSAGRLSRAMLLGEKPEQHFAMLATKAAGSGRATKAGVAVRKGAYQTVRAPAAVTNALADQLHLTNGMRILFPALNQKWARVNGEGLFENLNEYLRTGDADNLEKIYYGMSAVSGNFNIDERGMARAMANKIAQADPNEDRFNYTNGLIAKLRTLAADGDMRNLANPGIDFRRAVAEFQFSGRRARKAEAGARNFVGRSDEQYLQGLQDVLHRLTGGDEKLMEAIASGVFDGSALSKNNQALRQHISSLLDNPKMAQSLPDTMRYMKPEYAASHAVHDLVTHFFDFTGETSDMLQRAPVFRQAYLREAARLAPSMDPAEHAAMVDDLVRFGDDKLLREVTAQTPRGTLHRYEVDHMAAGFARKEQARIFYDAHERQNYAVAIRTLMPFAQATFNTIRRWGELSMANPQLMYRTLKPLNYAQQPGSAAIYGALGDLYGKSAQSALYDPTSYGWSTPDSQHNSVDGFSYTDNYGDRKFSYPLVGALGEWAMGIPQEAMNESSTSGLNVAGTSINPGFGPGVTFAASLFAQNLINRSDAAGQVTRWMFPYGLPQGNAIDKAVFSIAPSWLNKVIKSADDVGSVANLAAKLQPVLIENGHYDLTKINDQQRLATDSAELASRTFIWNAIIGTLTPSTVNTKALIADDPSGAQIGSPTVAGYTPTDGGAIINAILKHDPMDTNNGVKRFVIQDKMRQEWDKYTANADSTVRYRAGALNFVHDHGTTAIFSVIPSTKGEDGATPTQATNDVWAFHTNEPDTYAAYRPVIGLFFAGGSALVPGDTSSTGYASPLYNAQKNEGERQQMTPAEHVKAAMSEYGWLIYNPKKLEIEMDARLSSEEKSAALSQLSDNIGDLTDGAWSSQGSDPSKTKRLMIQLHTAVQDPTIQTLNSAPYIKDYMDYRDQIIAEMRHDGLTSNLSSQASQPYAIKLIDRAKELMRADPTGAFNNAWNRLLIKEYGGS